MKTFKQWLEESKKTDAHHPDLDVQPGQPFQYIRNTISSRKFTKHLTGDPYKQKIEPAGRYMQAITHDPKDLEPHMEVGTHKFENPLYVHWGDGYSHDNGWKSVLHSKYKKTGKRLSQAIRDDGHDGIVTVGTHQHGPYTSEIVDLTMFSPKSKHIRN